MHPYRKALEYRALNVENVYCEMHGMKFGCKPKPTPQQIEHTREQIDKGKHREDVAALLNVDRTMLYQVLI